LDTDAGVVFIKGLCADHPGAVRQGREAMINSHVEQLPPRLLWHDQAAGWDVLAFEYITGARHADYRPGSPDLPRVIDAMHQLAAISCPDLPVKQARQRWAAYVDREADLDLLDGDALLHTDFNPLNILFGPDRTWIALMSGGIEVGRHFAQFSPPALVVAVECLAVGVPRQFRPAADPAAGQSPHAALAGGRRLTEEGFMVPSGHAIEAERVRVRACP
jgi:hypothetical protein